MLTIFLRYVNNIFQIYLSKTTDKVRKIEIVTRVEKLITIDKFKKIFVDIINQLDNFMIMMLKELVIKIYEFILSFI